MVSHGLIHTFGCHRMRGESTVEWWGKDELENDMQKDLVLTIFETKNKMFNITYLFLCLWHHYLHLFTQVIIMVSDLWSYFLVFEW